MKKGFLVVARRISICRWSRMPNFETNKHAKIAAVNSVLEIGSTTVDTILKGLDKELEIGDSKVFQLSTYSNHTWTCPKLNSLNQLENESQIQELSLFNSIFENTDLKPFKIYEPNTAR